MTPQEHYEKAESHLKIAGDMLERMGTALLVESEAAVALHIRMAETHVKCANGRTTYPATLGAILGEDIRP